MRGIERCVATAPGTAMGGPRPPRRLKEEVGIAARRTHEIGASRAAADKREVHIQPILKDVSGHEAHAGTCAQDPRQESLRNQGVALNSRRSIDPPQAH
jgi:hypothetical protein